VASLVSAPLDEMAAATARLAEPVREGLVAGVHLEGPFLAAARCGAHDPMALVAPDEDSVRALLEAGPVVMVTLAPELDGGLAAVAALAERGVVAAVGHTAATAAGTRAAIAAGARVGTHLFNGMPPLHHREPGPALALLEDDRVVVELIADGVHVSAEVVRMVFETVGPQAIVLVSDAMSATGLADGPYRIGELAVDVTGGVARLREGGSIAGSTATLGACVDWCIEQVGLAADDVFEAASSTPAMALGL
jgi:N-acetylglucosamine-6-phosphate deacetylase